jgi:putative FmdB family regulatory protein
VITYPYRCQECGADFEVRRSIKESPSPIPCPYCDGATSQTFDRVPISFDATPKTLGGQADRNYARAGCYEREARQEEIRVAKRIARMEKDRLPPGMESVRNPDPQPTWWRPHRVGSDPRLVRSTPQEKVKYIEKGAI